MDKDTKGLVNKLLEAQYYTVFKKMDTDHEDALTYEQFKVFLYAIGLNFINDYFLDEVKSTLFSNQPSVNRVKFSDFIKYLDDNSTYNYTKQEFKQSLDLFD